MSPNPDPERESAWLEMLLRDEPWQAADALLRARALAAFSRRQRQRRWTRLAAGLLALSALAIALRWSRPGSITAPPLAANPTHAPAPPVRPGYLTDAQLLALFPKGSCILVEVDGHKQIIFFDPKLEQRYLAREGDTVP